MGQRRFSCRVNAVAVEHLTHLWRYLRTRPPEQQAFYHITEAFEHFTNQPPQSLRQFLRQHKESVRRGSGANARTSSPLA